MMARFRRKIAVVTGTRADYGHLFWVLREIESDAALELQLIVTGAHLSPVWGHTVDVISHDGFPIAARVDLQLTSDKPLAICKALAIGTMELADAFQRLAPDLLVLLGDRYEELAAAQAALIMKIPVAHIHGGETSEGAFDEAIRHAVTKMSHLHFVAASAYADRVRQLGEDPCRIFNYGAPGLDHLDRSPLATRNELEEFLEIRLGEWPLLVTYHPTTLSKLSAKEEVENLLAALDHFADKIIVFTGVNADPGYEVIRQSITEYSNKNSRRVRYVSSLGQLRYLGLMKIAGCVIGNSSSGLIEAPAVRVPTVNIGSRQRNRLKAVSVIDCSEDCQDIVSAINQAIRPDFRLTWPESLSLYGVGNSAEKIKNAIRDVNLDGIIMKHFFDIHPI